MYNCNTLEDDVYIPTLSRWADVILISTVCSTQQHTSYYTLKCMNILFVFCWLNKHQRARGYSFKRFLDHTQRRVTVGRTSLDE